MALSGRYSELRDRLLRQAALADRFAPRDLLAAVLEDADAGDVLLRGQLMSALSEASMKDAGTEEGADAIWRLRPAERRRALDKLPRSDVDAERRRATGRIGAALRGKAEFDPDALRARIDRPGDPAELSRLIAVLDEAGPVAPGHALLPRLAAAADRRLGEIATDRLLGIEAGDDAAAERLLKGIGIGRSAEIRRIRKLIETPQPPPLRLIHVVGSPGLGKTFMLQYLRRLARDEPDRMVVWLDFDRAPLRHGATDALYDEISRQIGQALPAEAGTLLDHRLQAAGRRTHTGSGSDEVPFDMLSHMVAVLAAAGRRVLFVLDTLEVVQGQGATFLDRLMDDLDRFVAVAVAVAVDGVGADVISAGRAPAFPKGHPRLRASIPLGPLDRQVTDALLRRLGVPEPLWERIAGLSLGNPLRMVLIARAVNEGGGRADAGLDEELREATNGYLYRAILSRMPPDLREIAAEGLILPCLDAEQLIHVVGPALDRRITAAEAAALMGALAGQSWLVRRQPGGGLTHQPQLRHEFLGLIYDDRPEQAARINHRAAAWQADRDPVLHLYHLLQLTRAGRPMPPVAPDLAMRMAEPLLEELPPPARDAVLQARGGRSREQDRPPMTGAEPPASPALEPSGHAPVGTHGWLKVARDPFMARLSLLDRVEAAPPEIPDSDLSDLRNMLMAGARREASHLMATRFDRPFPVDSPAGLLALTHHWRTGQWGMARRILDRLPPKALDRALSEDIGLTGLTLLELWAEFRFDRLCARLAEPPFREMAQAALAQVGRGGLRIGALEFALLAVPDPKGLFRPPDDVLGAVAPYLPSAPPHAAFDLVSRAAAMRAELGIGFPAAEGDPSAMAPAEAALALGPLNPYAQPIRALVESHEAAGRGRILDGLRGLAERLPELADLFAPGVRGADEALVRVGQQPAGVLAALNALGLTSDFARGWSFFRPVPDLPELARAAERWQQAVAGLWCHGRRRPRGWKGGGDALALDRARRMLALDDPATAARRALCIWAEPEGTADPSTDRMLQRRLRGRSGRGWWDGPLERRLTLLQGAGVAAVQQPALAVLAETGALPPAPAAVPLTGGAAGQAT